MKKRIVALLLVLVLSMAMMVPVFAAMVEPRACSHNYTPYAYSATACVKYDKTYHRYYRIRSDICTLCAMTQTVDETIRIDPHNFATDRKCSECGYEQGS